MEPEPTDHLVHNGQAPAHRPPDDQPERIGEGELGDGPSVTEIDGAAQERAETGRRPGGEVKRPRTA
jgi:hypothetical protein